MDFRGYIRAIRKSWWLVVLAAVVGTAVASLLVLLATPIYAAQVSFYVATPLLGEKSTLESTNQFAQDRANSYADLLSSERLGEMVVASTHLGLTPEQVASKISGEAKLNTVVVSATIHDTSRDRALAIADAVATAMPRLVQQLDSTASPSSEPPVSLQVVSGPSVSSGPVAPRKPLNLALGIALGLILGLISAVLRELHDTSVRSADELSDKIGLPLLGQIRYDRRARRTPVVSEGKRGARRAEDYRHLRTSLAFANASDSIRCVVVTSPTGGEGKSTTVANLGAVMAAAGKKVALIDADLRTPRLSTYLGLEGDRGLSTVLGGRANVLNVLQSWGDSGLQVLASGPLPVNPSELIGSTRMARVLAEMQDMFDLVIIDAPPLVPVTDAAVLSAHGSGVALLVQQNKTKQADVVAAMKILSTVDAKVLGAILNMRPAKGRGVDAYAVKVASSESRAAVGSRMLLPDDEDEVRPDSLTTIGAKPVRT